MRTLSIALTSLFLSASGASAYTMAITQPPDTIDTLFNAYVGQSNFTIPGLGHFVGPATVYAAGTSMVGVVAPTGPGDAFMGVLAVQDEFLVLDNPQTAFNLYWGSADPYNELEFINTSTHNDTFVSGGVLSSLGGVAPYSVAFSGLASFDEVEFHSAYNAFEFSLPGASAVPEPSTWAMLAIGMAAMGFVGIKKSRKERVATI